MNKLMIVMPCYNEEAVLPHTISIISGLLDEMIESGQISSDSQACFVNDGSSDKTWEIIEETVKTNKRFCGISLSRNFGHQGALLAGVYKTDADMYVTIDADLQDNPEAIKEMVDKYQEGFEVVYGVRDKRKSDTFFKKYTALAFYKIMELLGVRIVYNHADFRLMSRRAVEIMKDFPERNLFLRAIVPLIGFKSCKVYYDRTARYAGESKYPLKKMLAFAWNGISSFSIIPLRLVTLMGFVTCIFSFGLIVYSFYKYFVGGIMPGWASLMSAVTFFSSVTLLSLGIVGEYIGKIFLEVKKRPLFVVDKIIN